MEILWNHQTSTRKKILPLDQCKVLLICLLPIILSSQESRDLSPVGTSANLHIPEVRLTAPFEDGFDMYVKLEKDIRALPEDIYVQTVEDLLLKREHFLECHHFAFLVASARIELIVSKSVASKLRDGKITIQIARSFYQRLIKTRFSADSLARALKMVMPDRDFSVDQTLSDLSKFDRINSIVPDWDENSDFLDGLLVIYGGAYQTECLGALVTFVSRGGELKFLSTEQFKQQIMDKIPDILKNPLPFRSGFETKAITPDAIHRLLTEAVK